MNISAGTYIWLSIVAGIIGTTGMTLFLYVVTKSDVANADMVKAIGSLFTKSLQSATGVGLVIHFISGIIFAFFYILAISAFQVQGFLSNVGAGLLIGFIHGAVVSFLLVASVAEHHPLPQFQKAGFSVAAAHWIAHLIYGLLIGIVIGMTMF
ncbi:MAG: hypothetical protein ABI550_03290 [Ignavibacteriaceae bacterium]